MIATTTQLNRVGADLAEMPAVHAITDVTGFGLLGHTLEICRGSKLTSNCAPTRCQCCRKRCRGRRRVTAPVLSSATGPAMGEDVDVRADVAEWQKRLQRSADQRWIAGGVRAGGGG